MIWEIAASGTAATIHDNLLVAADSRDRELRDSDEPLGSPEMEQISVAIGMAASLVSRHQTGILTWDALLRGDTTPGSVGYRIFVGETAPEPPPAP